MYILHVGTSWTDISAIQYTHTVSASLLPIGTPSNSVNKDIASDTYRQTCISGNILQKCYTELGSD